jgi:ABC-2 type transport system ATP-binding protein
MIMIEVSKLTKNYGKVEALRNISISVAPGQIYGLLGPNGAGKSTTINILSGLLRPSTGSVSIGGFDVSQSPQQAKKILGVVPQQSVVIEELSAVQNCRFFGSLYGVPPDVLKSRSEELLDWVGLSGRKKDPVSQYSGGMMRRLTLVLALIHEPKALILDEPTVGLDPQTRLQILEHIQEVSRRGTAVLLSTHYLDEAERLCDRIGIIDEGAIIIEGTLHELRAGIEDVQIIRLRGPFDREPLAAFVEGIDGGSVMPGDEEEMVVAQPSASAHATRLLEMAASLENVREVSVRPPSLESLFIRLTGKELRE